MSLFCDACGSLKQRRTVRGETLLVCPRCGPSEGAGRAPDEAAPKQPPVTLRTPSRSSGNGARKGKRRSVQRRRSPADDDGDEGSGSRRRREPVPPAKIEVNEDEDLFPYPEVRRGQDQLVEDVEATVRQGRHLVAFAPTGLGKTVSTLAPALEHALRSGKRVFFLTSKQSQHEIAVDTLKAIRQRTGLPFVVADVIGKQDMCPRPEARELFHRRFAEFCRREQANHQCPYWENQNTQAVRFLKQDIHPVEEATAIAAQRFRVCPHQAALDLGEQAHVVVCDYNYFFSDMRESMQERLQVDPSEVVLIVDEAHNLPDRIRDHLTLELNSFAIDDAVDELRDLEGQGVHTAHVARALQSLGELLGDLAEDVAPDADHPWEDDERLVDRDRWMEAVDDHLARRASQLATFDYEALLTELRQAEDEFRDTFKESSRGITLLREFLHNWKVERSGLVRVLRRGMVPTLVYELLDPRVISRGVFRSVHASVLMSGTLYPTEMYRDVLGLEPQRTDLRTYRSPFPRENRLVLVDDAVTTRYKDRSDTMYRRIAVNLAEVAEATPGNVAAFFPSYAILDQVRTRLPALLHRKELVVEERDQDKGEKRDLVKDLRLSGNALLLGVQGGSLSEGYDYEGNLLKGVVIVGLPFARPTLTVEALIQYYQQKFGRRGRDYAYVYPAMNRVLQAAGRLIRGPEDRGVVLLADRRFAWRSNRRCLPDDLDPATTSDPAGAVRRFWR